MRAQDEAEFSAFVRARWPSFARFLDVMVHLHRHRPLMPAGLMFTHNFTHPLRGFENTGHARDPRRLLVTAAVKRVVVTAWLLDFYGDLGDKLKIEQAHSAFTRALDDLVAAYAK